jgi:hypothetical protein
MVRRDLLGRIRRTVARGRAVGAGQLAAALAGFDPEQGPLRLRGARIEGELDLAHRSLGFAVELTECEFTGRLDLTGLSVGALDLTGSSMPALHADGIAVAADLCLSGARIGVGGGHSVPLGAAPGAGDDTRGPRRVHEEHADAPVRLRDATVGGNLRAEELVIASDGPWALLAPRMTVEASLQARGLTTGGALYLRDARIGHGVSLNGASVGGLDATGIACGGSFHADWGFRSTGEVLMRGAQADSLVTFHDALLEAPAGGLILGRLTTARLRIDLRGAPAGQVVLRDARIGSLVDSPKSWPEPGRLDIEGLTYDRLASPGSAGPVTARDRLRWLGLAPGTGAGSYEQLAQSYEAAGDERSARTVRHARERRLRRGDRLTGRIWGAVQDALFGYGYAPRRALFWLVGLVAAGSAWFASNPPPPIVRTGQRAWDPVLYSLDLLIPVASLGYRSAFDPSGADKAVAVFLILSGWLLATAVIAGARRAVRG